MGRDGIYCFVLFCFGGKGGSNTYRNDKGDGQNNQDASYDDGERLGIEE